MYKFFFIVILSICFHNLNAQDNIILKNGEEIQAKVLEVAPDVVKYKKWDNQDGPVYTSTKAEIFMIKYANGSKDVFTAAEPPKPVDQSAAVIGVARAHMEKQIAKESEGAIKLINFEKQNGIHQEIDGQKMYTLEYSLVIEIQKPIWKASGDRFLFKDWYWDNFHVREQEGDIYSAQFIENYRRYETGTLIRITGEMKFEATDNGWRLGGEGMSSRGYDNKSSLDLSSPPATVSNTLPTPTPSAALPPAYKEISNNLIPTDLTEVDIIEKYIQAIGGRAKVNSVKTIDQTYLVSSKSGNMIYRLIQHEGKSYADITFKDKNILKEVFNGEELKVERSGISEEITPDDVISAKIKAVIFPELLFLDSIYSLKVLGIDKINNRPVFVLEHTLPSGMITTTYFDKETFLKVREINRSGSGESNFESIVEYSDYKNIDGLSIPHQIETSITSMQYKNTKKLNAIKINGYVDESLFKI